jgi:hypothetical protein
VLFSRQISVRFDHGPQFLRQKLEVEVVEETLEAEAPEVVALEAVALEAEAPEAEALEAEAPEAETLEAEERVFVALLLPLVLEQDSQIELLL